MEKGPVQKIRFISCVLHGKEVKKKKKEHIYTYDDTCRETLQDT